MAQPVQPSAVFRLRMEPSSGSAFDGGSAVPSNQFGKWSSPVLKIDHHQLDAGATASCVRRRRNPQFSVRDIALTAALETPATPGSQAIVAKAPMPAREYPF